MFFVISGFLITFLLLHEFEKTDTVDIPKFYLRRILRIWPIYYGYILIVFGILALFHLQGDLANPKIWFYLFLQQTFHSLQHPEYGLLCTIGALVLKSSFIFFGLG